MRTTFSMLALAFLLPVTTVQAQDEKLVDEVRNSIDKGVAWIKSKVNNGHWEDQSKVRAQYPGGATSLVVVALLNSGEDPKSKIIQDALGYLRTIPPGRTYTVGLQTMAFVLAKEDVDKPRIEKNLDWLEIHCSESGWGYGGAGKSDHSLNQYALLGVYEAMRAGYDFDQEKLKLLKAKMKRLHNYYCEEGPVGLYGYRSSKVPSLTMTTAGLCNLLITQRAAELSRSVLDKNGKAGENCGLYDEHRQIEGALRYIGIKYPAELTPRQMDTGKFREAYYCFYGIERAGRLTGRRFFGGKDWYRIGCRCLVDAQQRNGAWSSNARRDYGEIINTSFALLFLSKGRTPVLITKLAWGGEVLVKNQSVERWNRKRDDMRNLTEYVSRELFKGTPLAWQVFDIRGMPDLGKPEKTKRLTEELLASPVVWISGHTLDLGKEKEILKKYVDNGGFIVAEACCGEKNFDTAFRDLITSGGEDGFGATLVKLDASHPLWSAAGDKYAVNPARFELYGVEKGCKTVMIYNPGNNGPVMSGFWNKNLYDSKQSELGSEAFKMGANIIAYATSLEKPKPRLTKVDLIEKGAVSKPRRSYFQAAQLMPQIARVDLWEPAPGAMRVLMAELGKVGLRVTGDKKKLSLTSPNVVNYRFFYVHGRASFNPPTDEKKIKRLRQAIEDAGMLFADAACGNEEFDKSFRKMIEIMWPDKKLEPIDMIENRKVGGLFSREVNGEEFNINTVRYRRILKNGKYSKEYLAGPPKLEGIRVKGKWVVIYSPLDVGCALEKHNHTGCYGYDHESAKKIGRAVVMYVLRGR